MKRVSGMGQPPRAHPGEGGRGSGRCGMMGAAGVIKVAHPAVTNGLNLVYGGSGSYPLRAEAVGGHGRQAPRAAADLAKNPR